jgi:hypothetical protein
MAQVTSKEPGRVIAENVSVTVTLTGNTVLLEVPVEDIDQLGVELSSVTQAFDAFIFEGRMSPNGSYQTIKSTGWATPGGLLLASSGDLAALAAGASGFAVLDVRGLYSARFQGSKAIADSAATIRAIGKGHRA